ncbi:MAG: hypothetical protein ACYDEE_18185 [Ignavibacteriaceae bacterium]
MGKAVLIVTLGLSIIIGILIVNLNANSTRGLQTSVDSYSEMQSRLIANSGVEIYLEKLRRDKSLTGNFIGNSLMGGSYDVYISGPDSNLTIKSVGHFNGNDHTCIVTAKRSPISIPNITSSIYVSTADLGLNLSGNMYINGNDHNLDGSAGPSPSLPGIGVNSPTDSAYIINNIKPNISNSILGAGVSPSVSTVSSNTDWSSVTQNFIFAADTTISTGTYSSGTTLGTASNPKITYANGNVNFSGTGSGYGIMVVNGNLSMSGNFSFTGIVIVYGQSEITTNSTGNSGILGATIFVGQSVDFKATGNSSFFYSSQSIDSAKTNLKSSRFQIVKWWE